MPALLSEQNVVQTRVTRCGEPDLGVWCPDADSGGVLSTTGLRRVRWPTFSFRPIWATGVRFRSRCEGIGRESELCLISDARIMRFLSW